MKMNNLSDDGMVNALYSASEQGVKVDLIVRSICTLRPGVKSLSKNISVRSILGRFLEHSRIFYFENGGDEQIYIGSADMMPRNLDWRVETLIPIENPTVHRQVLDEIMVTNMKDQAQSWHLGADGVYTRVPVEEGAFSAHTYFMTNPSLSGRGSARKRSAQPPRLVTTRG
jgi:polyphosphate kinase